MPRRQHAAADGVNAAVLWMFALTGSQSDRAPDFDDHLLRRPGQGAVVELLIREVQSKESNCHGKKNSHAASVGPTA
jgi:hypothetical protein